MRPRSGLLALAAALVFAAGCAAMRPAERAAVPPTATVSSLRAKAIVEVNRGFFTVAGRASILARSPGSFRIEVFAPFGQTMLLMVSDGTELYLAHDGRAEKYRWDDPDIPFPFDAGTAFSFLTGAPKTAPASAGGGETRDSWGRLTGYAGTVEGGRPLSVTLGDYRDIDGAHIPFRIRFDGLDLDDDTRGLAIRYTEAEVNPALEDGLFSPEAGPPVEPKEVD